MRQNNPTNVSAAFKSVINGLIRQGRLEADGEWIRRPRGDDMSPRPNGCELFWPTRLCLPSI